mmetsp:Transcript_44893/g.100928  ORF Transcript_44893/g.100928 Transcript_44893/m.100928 type:complete len:568 (+) Transcript_44893:23-1726(+)
MPPGSRSRAMITYQSDGVHFVVNVFQLYGSVFPKALKISVPVCMLTAALVSLVYDLELMPYFQDPDSVMSDNAVWGGFSFFVGFLVVFRTSQAYSRFWEGCTSTHKMGAEWFDSCSALMAFTKASPADPNLILKFQNTLIRLFSMLHAAALGEIEDCGEIDDYTNVSAFNMELIDAGYIDEDSLRTIRDSDAKVELIFQWIQQLIVENIGTGVLAIAPPILTRSFQEIANGMVHFHDALKISNVPFPFPYAQTCDCLLLLHWFIVPFVVSQWCEKAWWAGVFSFIQVFTLWSLNLIAVELENPFGTDPNDIDGEKMQMEMNNHLRMLFRDSTRKTPTLRTHDLQDMKELQDRVCLGGPFRSQSFVQIWNDMSHEPDSFTRRYAPTRSRNFATVRKSNQIASGGGTPPQRTFSGAMEACDASTDGSLHSAARLDPSKPLKGDWPQKAESLWSMTSSTDAPALASLTNTPALGPQSKPALKAGRPDRVEGQRLVFAEDVSNDSSCPPKILVQETSMREAYPEANRRVPHQEPNGGIFKEDTPREEIREEYKFVDEADEVLSHDEEDIAI